MTNLLNDLVGPTRLVRKLPSWSIRLLILGRHVHLVVYVEILSSSVAVSLFTLPFLRGCGPSLRLRLDLLQLAGIDARLVGSQ
jgi:hypothetical protein